MEEEHLTGLCVELGDLTKSSESDSSSAKIEAVLKQTSFTDGMSSFWSANVGLGSVVKNVKIVPWIPSWHLWIRNVKDLK